MVENGRVPHTRGLVAANAEIEEVTGRKEGVRVTLADLEALIDAVHFYIPPIEVPMVVCFLRTKSGFVVIGKSAPADPRKFDEQLGKRLAQEDAMRQLWPLEGYRLRAELHSKKMAAEEPASL